MIRSNGTGQDGDAAGSRRSVSPLRRPRRPRRPRLAWTPRLSRQRLPTVWPCAQGEHRDSTGLLADWLLTVVVKLVTTYTEPGHRVLLLTPPSDSRQTTSGTSEVDAKRGGSRSGDLYAGLREAAWTVVRLGRGIQTDIASPTNSSAGSPTAGGLAEWSDPPVRAPEPGSHLSGPDPDSVDTDRADSHAPTEPASRLAVDPPDRFDLVITTVDPHASSWVRSWDWDRLLTVHDTLAIITHSDRRMGRLTHPTGSLVHWIRQAGLTHRDHAALLRVPIRHSTLDTGTELTGALVGVAGAPPAPVQVHSDLLVFAKPAATTTTTSADTETSDV